MDLLVLVLLTIIIILILKRLDSIIFFLMGFDILLRLISFLKTQIIIIEINNFLDEYIPESLPDMINKYSGGILNGLLTWGYLFVVVLFEYYLVKLIIKKSRGS